ncbi:hypothetical protein MKW92_017427 [Papaver armeniacum]|nr:hypothetical protein MKW92_017427 [Papaver armeniacum]
MIMDVLRALTSPNIDVRRKTIDIALELIFPQYVDEVVQALKKVELKTQRTELEKNGEYRQMLVQAIHSCAIKFPEVSSTMVHLLMDFLGDSNVASAVDVVVFHFHLHQRLSELLPTPTVNFYNLRVIAMLSYCA